MVRPVRFGGRFRLAGRALAARSASGAVFFSLLLGAAVLVCRPAVAAIPPDSAFSFEATPEFEGGVMPYRLFKAVGHDLPENAAKTYPLIIWLHGLGERKTPPDNTSQLKSYAKNLVSTANQAYEPAFLMVPQVDTATGNWAGETNPAVVKAETRLLLGIEDLKARFRIDPDRIYVMGLSFGGGGTWNLGIRHPGYFAAIAPMSQGAGAGAEQLGLLAHMPVWAFDGAADNAAGSTLSAVTACATPEAASCARSTILPPPIAA